VIVGRKILEGVKGVFRTFVGAHGNCSRRTEERIEGGAAEFAGGRGWKIDPAKCNRVRTSAVYPNSKEFLLQGGGGGGGGGGGVGKIPLLFLTCGGKELFNGERSREKSPCFGSFSVYNYAEGHYYYNNSRVTSRRITTRFRPVLFDYHKKKSSTLNFALGFGNAIKCANPSLRCSII